MFPPCHFAGHCASADKRYCRNPAIVAPAFSKLVTLSRCVGCQFAGAMSTALEPITAQPQPAFLPCVHRGAVLRTVVCDVCGLRGQTMDVQACKLHGECTPRRYTTQPKAPLVCTGCPDQVHPGAVKLPPLTGPANLMMFVYPRHATREIWLAQLEMIREAFPRFDGLRLLWIATDDSTAEGDIDLSGWTAIMTALNDTQQWELPGWRWAMQALSRQPGFTVRLHAKGGVRGTPELHLQRWWQLGFERMLDVDRVRADLQSHAVTGVFRRNRPAPNLGVLWHYAGSMYAFRNDLIFGSQWEPVGKVAPSHYVEAWPAIISSPELAGCIGWDGVGDLYQAKVWREVPVQSQREVSETSAIIQRPAKPIHPPEDRRSLIFHCFPQRGRDWRGCCFSTFRYRDVFNGRVLVSITTGPDCDDVQTVSEWFQQFAVEIEFAPNIKAKGINTTFRNQLRAVQHEPGIVFKGHTKGISHAGDPFRGWRDNMAKGCLSNVEFVKEKFDDGYRSFGVFKTVSAEGSRVMGQDRGPCKTDWPGWHFPGAFFWFDPRFIPEKFFDMPLHHYENEAFPCHMGPTETGYCLTPNNLNFQVANINHYFACLNAPLKMETA